MTSFSFPHNTNTEQALSIVRDRLKTAQLNTTRTVIAATIGGQWYAVAYKGSQGWCEANTTQRAQSLPSGQFPSIPPTALDIYCKLRGWQGGTIHQAVSDLRQQGTSFKDRLMDELPAAEWDTMGVDALLSA